MAKKRPAEEYVKKALKYGFQDAKEISPQSIVTAAWVRMKCQFGCSGYGQCLTCPPYSPTPDETGKILKCYKKAILVHGGKNTDVTGIAVKLEREAFLDGYYKAFAMGAGPCRVCDECNLECKECRNPDKARPSMEACGIDVFQTARNNGFPIEVVRNNTCEQNYYGVVLME